jgi:hypothetical protein
VPKSVFGQSLMDEDHLQNIDDPENIVELTGREHFIAHWLLHRAFPKVRNFAAAFHVMASMSNKHHKRYTPSSRVIEEARIANSDSMKLPVAMYSLEGILIKTFETTEQAAKEVGSSVHNISAACGLENQVNNIKGFQWRRFENFPDNKIEQYINQNNKSSLLVHEYDLFGNYIKTYNSIRDAASKGVERTSLKSKFRNNPMFSKDKWYLVNTSNAQKSIKVKKTGTQRKKVVQIDPETGNVIKIWKSTREPESVLGISNVSSVCKGKRKTMGGFIWKYAEEDYELNLDSHKKNLFNASQIEVFINDKSIGTFLSLRKAEESLGIKRNVLSKALKSGSINNNGFKVIKI